MTRLASAFALVWFIALTFVSSATAAQFSAKDGQVLGRTLGFVGDGMTGVAVVGVVVSTTDPASRQDADAVRDIIGADLPAGRVRLQVQLVPLEQLGTAAGLAALYVTTGLTASMDKIAHAARRLHIPTISTDLGCVQTGGCVVGFTTEPTVQIIIDKEQADRIGVHFMQAFRMLVREK